MPVLSTLCSLWRKRFLQMVISAVLGLKFTIGIVLSNFVLILPGQRNIGG